MYRTEGSNDDYLEASEVPGSSTHTMRAAASTELQFLQGDDDDTTVKQVLMMATLMLALLYEAD